MRFSRQALIRNGRQHPASAKDFECCINVHRDLRLPVRLPCRTEFHSNQMARPALGGRLTCRVLRLD